MTWLTPLTGVILALVLVPPLIALYFLKLRRTHRSIPSTLLWNRSVEDLRANAPFQRLRFNLLLLLQLLILLLLALSLAQPQFEGDGSRTGRTVIAIDNSASMNATDEGGGQSRLDAAKESAIARIEKLHGGGLFSSGSEMIMVLSFADGAEVRTPFTDSRAQAIQAVRGIQPSDESTKIGDALDLSRAFAMSVDPESLGSEGSQQKSAVFELFSDGRIKDLDDLALGQSEFVRYTVFGTPNPKNLAITQLAAERPWNQPDSMQVFVVIENSGPEDVQIDVELRVDGRPRSVTPEPLNVPAATLDPETGQSEPGREQISFVPFDQPREAIIEVALLHRDALASDDSARLTVPAPRNLRVALVGSGDVFVLQSLLEGMPLASLELLSPESYLSAIETTSDQWDVIVMVNWTPESFGPGRYLIFGSVQGLPELIPFGEAQKSFVRSARDEHPIFRFVTLDDLFIWKMPKVQPGPDVAVLAESTEGPVIVEITRPGTDILWVAFDPLDSTWWHQRGFANFIPNTLEHLATSGGLRTDKGLRPGEVVSLLVPSGSTDAKITLPDETEVVPMLDQDGYLSWGPVSRAGLHKVTWLEPGGRAGEAFVSVNLLDSSESSIGAREVIDFSVNEVQGVRSSGSRFVSVWPWLLGIGLFLLMLEWYVYHRRVGS
jgi:hypothetical protein